MPQSDEELLHAFYAGDNAALEQLSRRHDLILRRIAYLFLLARSASMQLALDEWDIYERLDEMWANLVLTRITNAGVWPYQRISALRWIIFMLCEEMDRNMGIRGPF